MPAREPSAALLLAIDPGAAEPLQQQVYRELRDAILSGRLRAGSRLPATRTLAADLGVSRNTVVPAFDQLRAEGFVESRVGAGTRVVAQLPDVFLRVRGARPVTRRPAPATAPRPQGAPGALAPGVAMSGVARAIAATLALPATAGTPPRAFRIGVPAREAFPTALWGRMLAQRWRRSAGQLVGSAPLLGYEPLRAAIAEHVSAARGVRCVAEQVIVTSGAQVALAVAARAALDPGEEAWVEEPGYLGTKAALLAAGARLVPVPVRDGGIDVAEGVRRAPGARLACVTPSNQHPLGGAMPLPTRLALLEWATRAGAWILEDDYDSEYRYVGRPLLSLQGLDCTGRVLYVGTFSKTMMASLRLGFLVVPLALVPAFRRLCLAGGSAPPLLEQAVLTDFIADGHYVRHVRRMRALYAERQQRFRALAAAELGELLDIAPIEAGMRLVGYLPPGIDDQRVRDEALARGVEVEPLSHHYLGPPARAGLLLGFAAYGPGATRTGLARLGEAIRAAQRG